MTPRDTPPPAARPSPEVEERERVMAAIIRETLWMARRYADGRRTYAVQMVNDAIRQAEALGISVGSDQTLRDPNGRLAIDGDEPDPAALRSSHATRERELERVIEAADAVIESVDCYGFADEVRRWREIKRDALAGAESHAPAAPEEQAGGNQR